MPFIRLLILLCALEGAEIDIDDSNQPAVKARITWTSPFACILPPPLPGPEGQVLCDVYSDDTEPPTQRFRVAT